MTDKIESELKYRIHDHAGFEEVLAFLGPAQSVHHQTNFYFSNVPDQPSGLWTLRVRKQDDDYELTLKRGRQVVGAYFQAREVECALDQASAEALIAGDFSEESWALPPLRALEEVSGRGRLYLLGSMENWRHRCPERTWGVPELDITHFPDGSVDYELEIETEDPQAVEASLLPVIHCLTEQLSTKFRRFLERRPN